MWAMADIKCISWEFVAHEIVYYWLNSLSMFKIGIDSASLFSKLLVNSNIIRGYYKCKKEEMADYEHII